MADNIGTVYIPAPVIQLKTTQFIENGVIVPQTLEVPCRSVHIDIGQYWAIPTKNNGIFTGLWMQPAYTETGTAIPQPTFDSFQVLRLRDKKKNGYTWWIAATLTQYTAACNTCCGSAFTPIPEPILPVVSPCQYICDAINDDGNYYVVFAAPILGAGEQYVINGAWDNFSLPELTASSLDDLITQLNSNYDTIGDFSPQATVIWTRDDNTIIGTLQGGLGLGITFCLSIITETT